MCLLDFIKQQNGKRVLPNCIGQLASGFIADISGRRPQQLLIAMALAIFAHIKTNAAAFIAKELFGQCLCRFRFPCSRWACKEKNALGLCMGRTLQPGHAGNRAFYNIQRFGYCKVLAFYAFLKIFLGGFQFVYIQPVPRIFLNPVSIKVYHGGHLPNFGSFVFAKPPQAVEFCKAEALC